MQRVGRGGGAWQTQMKEPDRDYIQTPTVIMRRVIPNTPQEAKL